MGAPFAQPSDLAALLQVDSVDPTSAALYLQMAADTVRAEVDQEIDLGTTIETLNGPQGHDKYYMSWPINSVVFLHERPVLAIPTIQEWQASSQSFVTLVEYVDYIWDRGGAVVRITGGNDDNPIDWTRRRRGIKVTYTHGWAQNTYQWNLAKSISTQVAARAFVNPENIHQEDFGGYSVRYRANAELTVGHFELTKHEQQSLSILRGNSLTG